MTDERKLSAREVAWVALALLLGLVPHMARFPAFLSIAFVTAALWRVLGAMGRLPLPDREHRLLWLGKQCVALMAFVSVYVAYHGQLGREAGVELLAALLGLKLLEMRGERDYYVVTLLCYFLVVTNFFYSQTMLTALYMLALVLLVTTILIQFNTPPAWRDNGAMLRLSATMTAQAVPLMLIAFVLFPRLPGPLWGLPQDAFDAVSGLSDQMTVGEIARLGLSDEIAFRVEFHGDEPRARDLYWRGPVLWNTDGRTWEAGQVGRGPPAPVTALGPTYRYTMMVEPHRRRWLPALEMVTRADSGTLRTSDHRLRSTRMITRRKKIDLESVVDYRVTGISELERQRALTLPPNMHTRARALAREWATDARSNDDVVKRALDMFRRQSFYYSLTPPKLPRDPVDEFLFETREGFCEHFTNAFVVLMRAAGIPARVVTGYQGGEYSTIAEYLIVRQRDAHAWAEIYDETRGWIRVDPTAAVAPSRVSLGFDSTLPRRAGLSRLDQDGVASVLLSRVRDSFDALTYGWNQWVLGYSPQQQQRLLADVGLEDWDYGSLVIALTLSLAGAMIALGIVLMRGDQRHRDPVQRAWLEFCRRLRRVGLERGAAEAPRAYADRVMRARADLAREVVAITRLYTRLRYGSAGGDATLLARRVRRFRPRRAR